MDPRAVSVLKGKVWLETYTLKNVWGIDQAAKLCDISKPNDEAKVRAVCRKNILIEGILLFQTSVFTLELLSMNEAIGLQA